MTTPSFIPQTAATLTDIRYYTPFDTYYYTTDNRPLEDIAANITEISEGGGDSARRAVLMTQLALSEVMRSFVSDEMYSTYGFFTGLTISKPGSNQITVAPGGLYQFQAINAGIAAPIVKQGLKLSESTFSVPPPGTAGQSINYLVQARLKDSTVNMPFFDSANSYLPCLLLNGELELGLIAGVAAASGSQVTPTPTVGWTALYAVTATYGSTTYGSTSPVLTMATNSPMTKRIRPNHGFILPEAAGNPATMTNYTTAVFADSADKTIVVPVPVFDLNPLFPIQVQIVYSAASNVGDVVLLANYYSYDRLNSNGTPAVLVGSNTISMASNPANTIDVHQFTTSVPTSYFADFVGGEWASTAVKAFLTLARLGTHGSDTLAADFYIHDVIVFQ